MVALGRPPGGVTKSYILTHGQQADTATLAWAFENSEPTPRVIPLLTRTHLLILPNSSPTGD